MEQTPTYNSPLAATNVSNSNLSKILKNFKTTSIDDVALGVASLSGVALTTAFKSSNDENMLLALLGIASPILIGPLDALSSEGKSSYGGLDKAALFAGAFTAALAYDGCPQNAIPLILGGIASWGFLGSLYMGGEKHLVSTHTLKLIGAGIAATIATNYAVNGINVIYNHSF